MKNQRFYAIILVVVLLLQFSFPVMAKGGIPDVPKFTVELVKDSGAPGVYGTLSNIPKGTVQIFSTYYNVFYGTYEYVEKISEDWKYREWILNESDSGGGGPVQINRQLCAAPDEYPLSEYLDEMNSRILFRLEIILENGDTIFTEPALISRNKPSQPPLESPPFNAFVSLFGDGWQVKGTFKDLTPDVLEVRPMYSTDNVTYKPIDNVWNLYGLGDNDETVRIQTQTCIYDSQEPMKSYLKGTLKSFYLRLQIMLESGKTYHTQSVLISQGKPQAPPKGAEISLSFPSELHYFDRTEKTVYGNYQVTAREGSTKKDLLELLPETIPVRVDFYSSSDCLVYGVVECPVDWNLPSELSLKADDGPIKIKNAASKLVISAGEKVVTPAGIYVLPKDLTFANTSFYDSGEVRLSINVIPKNAEPEAVLSQDCNGYNAWENHPPMSLLFNLKPSGATALNWSYYVKGDKEWTECGNLLDLEPVNYYPMMESYGYLSLFSEDEAPYRDYLAGKIEGFLVYIGVEGGVYDGQEVILPWPFDYKAPPGAPKPSGSGGNKGDAGSSNNSGNSNGSGQRPNLSQNASTSVINPTEYATIIVPAETTRNEPAAPKPSGFVEQPDNQGIVLETVEKPETKKTEPEQTKVPVQAETLKMPLKPAEALEPSAPPLSIERLEERPQLSSQPVASEPHTIDQRVSSASSGSTGMWVILIATAAMIAVTAATGGFGNMLSLLRKLFAKH